MGAFGGFALMSGLPMFLFVVYAEPTICTEQLKHSEGRLARPYWSADLVSKDCDNELITSGKLKNISEVRKSNERLVALSTWSK